jgi:DNA-binding beta-propeller fold protein YncE
VSCVRLIESSAGCRKNNRTPACRAARVGRRFSPPAATRWKKGGYPFYFTNRGWNTLHGGRHGPGSITVIDPITRKILATWPIPNGGSPDMGGLGADAKELWVSGRYDNEVYAIDTGDGWLLARIPVDAEPHGLCVWPQPGRFSLGHTGNMR